MGYLVLSRKYRPQSFEEVVKQEHVTQTLKNAISSGRLAHAILFSGPRGTGKTTIARILAKCVNCATGPTPTPCNNCHSCREITSGHAADVFEIDGASNNKVDNIRELRENAVYMPAHSPFKIYIIDEVHMLSDSAFNALLKILEEPPSHVMFFFATTEPNKIPITILSRCQRHDLRRIEIDPIIGHLEEICRKEGIQIDKNGLTIIAREADGSIRDALSLLDHVMSSAQGDITIEAILDILGGIDRQVLFDMSNAVFKKNAVNVLEIIDRLYSRGQHMMRCFIEILDHFRNLLVVKMGGDRSTLADVPDHEIDAMRKQVSEVPLTHLNQILDMLYKEEKIIKHAAHPKLALEMAFIRILQIEPVLSLDELIGKIDDFQKGVIKTLSSHDRIENKIDGGSSATSAPQDKTTNTPGPSEKKKKSEDSPDKKNHIKPSPSDALKEKKETSQEKKTVEHDESIEESWKKILELLSRDNPSLAACFSESKVIRKSDQKIVLEFVSNQFNSNYVQRKDNLSLLKKIWSDYLDSDIEISLKSKPASNGDAKEKRREKKQLQDEAINHPLVAKAVKLFNGKIVDIKIL